MHHAIALVALSLLAALAGSLWLRRADLEFNGELPAMLFGVAFSVICVLLIVVAAA